MSEPEVRAIRYETFIVTFIGVSALFVSAYTAYMQRQQVRAAVWPILQYDTSNGPSIRFTLQNKGVGPAIIQRVIVKVDGQPVRTWAGALKIILGPGPHHLTESNMNGHVLSAGESMDVLTPHDAGGNPITPASGAIFDKMDKDRSRVSVEICYSSTLGDRWLLRSDGNTSSVTRETRSCPNDSTIAFEQ